MVPGLLARAFVEGAPLARPSQVARSMLRREELHQLKLALLAVVVVVVGFAMCGGPAEAPSASAQPAAEGER
jgi:hypothetical protein